MILQKQDGGRRAEVSRKSEYDQTKASGSHSVRLADNPHTEAHGMQFNTEQRPAVLYNSNSILL